ncbi:MAG: hypothetical protein R3B47_17240 [Bacteroidia bacterium]
MIVFKTISAYIGLAVGLISGILAQDPPAPYPHQTEQYCKVIITWTPNDGSGNQVCGAMIDFGNPVPRFRSKRQLLILRDDAAEPLRFNSPVDILNYMNSKGWSLVHAFEQGDEDIRYLMKRKL